MIKEIELKKDVIKFMLIEEKSISEVLDYLIKHSDFNIFDFSVISCYRNIIVLDCDFELANYLSNFVKVTKNKKDVNFSFTLNQEL